VTRRRRSVSIIMAVLVTSCMPPGGGVSGYVLTDAGAPISGARIQVDLGGGGGPDMVTDSGHFMTVWSHGSWNGVVVRASAAGRQTAEATAKWESSTCVFHLASANAAPGTSKATCQEANER
jgi:hypothetical protein